MNLKKIAVLLLAVVVPAAMTGCRQATPTLPDQTIERITRESDEIDAHRVYTVPLLMEEAELVVCGDVERRVDPTQEADGDSWVVPIVQMRVREVLSGDAAVGQTLYVKDTGYPTTRDNKPVELTEWGEPCMLSGQRVVLFLYAAKEEDASSYRSLIGKDDRVYEIAAEEIGKFFVDDQDMCYPAVYFSKRGQAEESYLTTFDPMEPQALSALSSAALSSV